MFPAFLTPFSCIVLWRIAIDAEIRLTSKGTESSETGGATWQCLPHLLAADGRRVARTGPVAAAAPQRRRLARRETHRVGPSCASWPSMLAENLAGGGGRGGAAPCPALARRRRSSTGPRPRIRTSSIHRSTAVLRRVPTAAKAITPSLHPNTIVPTKGGKDAKLAQKLGQL